MGDAGAFSGQKATLADYADWLVVRECFVVGAGNVDILLRNRALGGRS